MNLKEKTNDITWNTHFPIRAPRFKFELYFQFSFLLMCYLEGSTRWLKQQGLCHLLQTQADLHLPQFYLALPQLLRGGKHQRHQPTATSFLSVCPLNKQKTIKNSQLEQVTCVLKRKSIKAPINTVMFSDRQSSFIKINGKKNTDMSEQFLLKPSRLKRTKWWVWVP